MEEKADEPLPAELGITEQQEIIKVSLKSKI